MKLRQIKIISKKTWKNLKIKLDQKKKEGKKKRNAFDSIGALYEGQ